jgi:hypothetical protein
VTPDRRLTFVVPLADNMSAGYKRLPSEKKCDQKLVALFDEPVASSSL